MDVTQGKKVEKRVLDAKGIVVYILIMNTTPAISNQVQSRVQDRKCYQGVPVDLLV